MLPSERMHVATAGVGVVRRRHLSRLCSGACAVQRRYVVWARLRWSVRSKLRSFCQSCVTLRVNDMAGV